MKQSSWSPKLRLQPFGTKKRMLLEEESAVEQAALPQAIKDALAADFKDCKINEAEKVTANDVVTFEMEAKCGKKKCELVFDTNGKLIEKEEKKADEDKD